MSEISRALSRGDFTTVDYWVGEAAIYGIDASCALAEDKRVVCYDGSKHNECDVRVIEVGPHAGENASMIQLCHTEGGLALKSSCWYCEGYNLWFLNGTGEPVLITNDDGRDFTYSRSYADEHACICETCGEQVFRWVSRGPTRICHACAWEQPNGLLEYNDRTAGRFTPEDTSDILMGIELECEAHESVREGVRWVVDTFPWHYVVCKRDGSLDDDYGMEIVTRPDSFAVHRREWTKAIEGGMNKALRSWHGYSCGMHVHIGKAELTNLQMDKMSMFMNSMANQRFIETVAGRTSDRWARFSEKHWGKTASSDKYEALNTCPQHTIEFRVFRGNLSLGGFLKNLEFCHALTKYCAPAECSTTEVLNYLGFTRFIIKNRATYPNLCQFLKSRNLLDVKSRDIPIEYTEQECDWPVNSDRDTDFWNDDVEDVDTI